MPRLLFCVDHVFQTAPDGTVHTTGGKFPYAKWQEYLEFFDEVVVVARTRHAAADACAELAVSSGPNVIHHLLGKVRGAGRLLELRRQRRIVAQLVDGADAVIGRLPSELGLTACVAARRAEKPYLVELVGCPWDALVHRGGLAARAYAPLMAWRTRRAVAPAALVHYVTRRFLQRRYPTTGGQICASNVMLPPPPPEMMAARAARLTALAGGERAPVFGTIGSMLTRLKGIDVAIAALGQEAPRLPALTYRVLGEGDPARLVECARAAGIGDRVHFDGTLPGAEAVAAWLDDIDVFLQPSYQEGLPRATIEAMNRGCLVIGSTAGGIPELLPTTRLHPPGDANALARQIAKLMRDPAPDWVAESQRNFDVAQEYAYDRSLAEKQRIYRALRRWVDTGTRPSPDEV